MSKTLKVSPQAKNLLRYLLLNRFVTTTYCRDELSIMSPAPRIKELIDAGLPIVNIGFRHIDANGVEHRIARYYLPIEKLTPEQWNIHI